jgi:AraC-like DNA-binding protein
MGAERNETLSWRRPGISADLQLLSGSLSKEPFPTMIIDGFFIGYYVSGAVELLHRGRRLPLVSNQVSFYEPQELIRTSQRSTERGVFHAVLAPREAIRQAVADIGDDERTESFGCRVLGAEVATPMQRFADAVVQEAASIEQETRWLEVVASLFGGLGDVGLPPRVPTRHVRRAREYLHAHAGRAVSLEELAHEVQASKFHLVRAFHRTFGLPPHRYHLLLRLGRARDMLAVGATPADVALDLGFADQSHFHRAFKRAFGITPGAWVALFARP